MKAEIDRYFQLNYKKIVSIAQKKVSYFGAECDAESLVSEAYLNLTQKPPQIEADIPKWVTHFIHRECSFFQSKSRRQVRQRHCEMGEEVETDNVSDHMELVDFDKELKQLKTNLTAPEQVIVDMYLIKGIKSGADLAKHFGIPRATLYYDYRNLLTKLKEYETLKRGVRRSKH